MLGQHPQMYGVPELELFAAETVREWWELCAGGDIPASPRRIARGCPVVLWEQTAETVKLARGWLRRRTHFTTGYLLETLAEKVAPRIVVDKSTSNVYQPKSLRRAAQMFPGARFIHLVRHPRGHGESVLKFLREREKEGRVPAAHWMRRLAAFPDQTETAPMRVRPVTSIRSAAGSPCTRTFANFLKRFRSSSNCASAARTSSPTRIVISARLRAGSDCAPTTQQSRK